jgi:two-component system sensor histidine kinase/response regulator
VVLTDWQMPGMDGITLARRIAGNPALRQPPSVVLVTAFGREEVQQEAEAAGIRGFLCKPIGQSALVDTLVALFAPPRLPNARSRGTRKCGGDCVARVLLVEDNQVNQQIALELLQAQNIAVEVAATGREALDLLHEGGPQAYDLVLMDLEMPQLDGHAATVELRKDARFDKLPIDRHDRARAGRDPRALPARRHAGLHQQAGRAGKAVCDPGALDRPQLPPPLPRRWAGPAWPTARPAGPVHLSGIDSAFGLRHVAGNVALYVQLLDRFRATQRDAGTQIRADYQAGPARGGRARPHAARRGRQYRRARAADPGAGGGRGPGAGRPTGTRSRPACARWRRRSTPPCNRSTATSPAPRGAPPPAPPEPSQAARRCAGADARQAVAQLDQLLAEFSGDATDYFETVRARWPACSTPSTGAPGAAPVALRIRRGAPAAAAGRRHPPRYRGNP